MIDPGPAEQTMGPFKGRRNAQGRYVAVGASPVAPPSDDLSASGVTGTIAEGETITIHSDGNAGFGSGGVSLHYYNDFKAGADGQNLIADEHIGNSGPISVAGRYTDKSAHSGDLSTPLCDLDRDGYNNNVDFPQSTQVRVAYWLYRPIGAIMPNLDGDVDENGYALSGSNFKITWLFRDGQSGASPDICLPTQITNTQHLLAGNSSMEPTYLENIREWFTVGEWCFFAAFIDGENQRTFVREWSPSLGWREFGRTIPNTDEFWGTAPAEDRYFSRFNFVGYVRNGSNATVYLDDLELCSGPGAGALVLIGDAPTLAECTDFIQVPLKSKADDAIEVEVRSGPFSSLPGKHLFVLGEDMSVVTYNGAESREIV